MSILKAKIPSKSENFEKRNYFVRPDPGMFHAVCVDVVDKGDLPFTYKGVTRVEHCVQFVFQTKAKVEKEDILAAKKIDNDETPYGENDEKLVGQRFLVFSRNFPLKYGEKAALRQFLESWEGDNFEPGDEVDLESFVGKNALIVLQNNKAKNGVTYLNLVGVSPIGRREEKIEPLDYVRRVDREKRDSEFPPKEPSQAQSKKLSLDDFADDEVPY